MRNKVINIAIGELGYKEGANNSNKYSYELYGLAQEWCADFVRWCLIKAGVGDIYPVSSYVPTIANWYSKKGQYKNSQAFGGNYVPQTADIILFDYNHDTTSDHIGLVEKVENGKIYTIEGNASNMVKRCEYSLYSRDIRAYCAPEYEIIEEIPQPSNETIDNLVEEILKGIYGVGEERRRLLNELQDRVIDKLAREVIEGKWGNGTERRNRLEEAGYSYSDVQKRVNEILR